jgi:hypothetical protein
MFKLRDLEEANIDELKRVMVFTVTDDDHIEMRQYEEVNKKLNEIGPSMNLTIKRT